MLLVVIIVKILEKQIFLWKKIILYLHIRESCGFRTQMTFMLIVSPGGTAPLHISLSLD